MWAWVCDECCGGDGRYHHMHGMCGRTVQQRVDGGVHRVSGGINDGRALGDRGDYVRGVCGWSVQCRIDDGVRCVRGWVCDERAGRCERHQLHGVSGGSVQCRIDDCLCSVCSSEIPGGSMRSQLFGV